MPSRSVAEALAAVDAARDEIVALTQALVQLPTINTGYMPTGNETAAAELLKARYAAEGIAAEVVESDVGRGNVVARIPGSGGAPSLMLMGHLDVVPVEDPAQWSHPPFGGEVHDGRIHGRGANDMKSMVAAEAMAAIILKRLGAPFAGDLIVASAADEESGGKYGFGWLALNRPDLLRCDVAVNEGGGTPLHRDGRITYGINTGEKGRLEIRITVKGRGYHASAPWMADNAIYKAWPVLERIAAYQPEVSVDADLFRHLHAALGIIDVPTRENIDQIIDALFPVNPNAASWLRSASRMTIVASMIDAGVKSNSVAETCLITCDVRTLPWQEEAYVARQLDAMLDGLEGVSYEIVTTATPSASPYDDPFVGAMQAAVGDALGRDDLAFFPGLTTGFTDSRLVRPLGINAYGFGPAHPDSDPSLDGAHNINESASIEDLMLMTRFMVTLACRVTVGGA
jgi:acetylornithine deacetylase/succinyl-diaminopimelate desuccinylase-like protein